MSLSPSSISLPPTPKALLDIIKLEAGPADLPGSRQALWISLAAYAATEAGGQMVNNDIPPSLAYGLLSAVLLTATTFGALVLSGARERFQKTLIALAATGAVIGVVSIVLALAVSQIFPPPLPAGKLVAFLLFPLVLWKITVFIWLFRHASLRFIPALAISLIYVGFTLVILSPLLIRAFKLI